MAKLVDSMARREYHLPEGAVYIGKENVSVHVPAETCIERLIEDGCFLDLVNSIAGRQAELRVMRDESGLHVCLIRNMGGNRSLSVDGSIVEDGEERYVSDGAKISFGAGTTYDLKYEDGAQFSSREGKRKKVLVKTGVEK
ncbi:MAG: hypothetical protein AABX71_01390 [Nanoarchaeota archaeon]